MFGAHTVVLRTVWVLNTTVNRDKVVEYHVLFMFTLLKCPPTLCKPSVHAVMRKQGDVEVQEDEECVQQQHQGELHHP